MYKVNIDPITKKISSYTAVQSNTPVYADDLIVDSETLNDMLKKEEEAKAEKGTSDKIYEELVQLTEEPENTYLMRMIVDESKDLEEARNLVKQRRDRIEELKKMLEERAAAHERSVREYYVKADAAADYEKKAAGYFKHYSAVILLIKDENRYLREWLDWHLKLGFDHIYIYDNGSKEKVSDVIDVCPVKMRNQITVIDWSGHHTHIQQDAYNHFLDTYKKEVRWGLFIDSDEFVKFTDGKTTNVNDFLKDYEDYTEIWGYEIEYNANGKEFYEDKPVKERFTKTVDVRDGYFWKNFVQVNRISHFTMHYAQYNDQKHFLFKNEDRNSDLFVIEHYYTKSWEEWNWKIKQRGGADPNYHKILSEFFFYNPDMKNLDTGENVAQAYEGRRV